MKDEFVLERERTAKALAATGKALADLEGERARTGMVVADYRWLAEEFERQTAELVDGRVRPWWQPPFLPIRIDVSSASSPKVVRRGPMSPFCACTKPLPR